MSPTSQDAWSAYEAGDGEEAARLWEELIGAAPSAMQRRELELGYGYTLVKLGRFDKARALYQKLFDETGKSVYLHQLGMVEREAGAYDEALRLLGSRAYALLKMTYCGGLGTSTNWVW